MNRSLLLDRLLWGFVLILGLSSCSSLISKPESPRLTLVGLQLISVELLEQRYQVSVRVKNPNDFELPIRGIDFRLDINDQAFADGVSKQSVTVPPYGEVVLELEVTSNLLRVFRQFQSLQEDRGSAFNYRINGRLATGGIYSRKLPFDYSGELQLSDAIQSDAEGAFQ